MKKLLSIILAAALAMVIMPTSFAAECADGKHNWGSWTDNEDGSCTHICQVCGATDTCNHEKYNLWYTDGDKCARHCAKCGQLDSHISQLGEYENYNGAGTTPSAYNGTIRRCSVCNHENRIDTVEELLAAMAQGLTEIRPDYYSLHPGTTTYSIHNSPITVTQDVVIDGGENGVTIQRLGFVDGSTKAPTFIVENGATLTLKNLTIRGGGVDMGGDFIIRINDGTVILDDGATLSNGYTYKSGCAVELNNGNLVMNEGSKVTGNLSGSAIVVNKGTFTMNGGEISNNGKRDEAAPDDLNKGLFCKAVSVIGETPEDAVFIMNGGSISENYSSKFSFGIVDVGCGTMTLNGGKITNNTGDFNGGIVVGNGSLTVTDGEISGNSGLFSAGIMSAASIEPVLGVGSGGTTSISISGGTIKDNKAIELSGITSPQCDVLAGYTNAEVTGGNIGTFGGNTEAAKAILAMSGVDSSNMTEEELNTYMKEDMGLTDEQLAMAPSVSGGIFGNDVSKYVTEASTQITYTPSEGSALYAVGNASAQEVLKNAGAGDAVTIVSGDTLDGVPDGVSVTNNTGNDININGETVPGGETVVIGTPVSVTWTTDTDAGYYLEADKKIGMMRFLFNAAIDGEVTKSGIKYIKGSNLETPVYAAESTGEAAKTFFGDVINIPENTEGTYYAVAYVEMGGETYWSQPVSCSPSFAKYFAALDKVEGEVNE